MANGKDDGKIVALCKTAGFIPRFGIYGGLGEHMGLRPLGVDVKEQRQARRVVAQVRAGKPLHVGRIPRYS